MFYYYFLSELESYTILEYLKTNPLSIQEKHTHKNHIVKKYTLVGKKTIQSAKLKALYYKIIPKVTENNYSNKKEKKLKTKAKKH